MDKNNPRTLVLGGNRGRWHFSERPEHMASTDNTAEAWAHALGGDYCYYGELKDAEIGKYDLIIANGDWAKINWLPRIIDIAGKRSPSARMVFIIEGNAVDYLRPMSYIREAMDSADLVNCINPHTKGLFEKMTRTKVEFIGFPYPAKNVAKFGVPIEKRNRRIFLCPYLLKRWTEYFVAREIGLEYYGYEQHITRKPKKILENLRTHRSLNSRKYIQEAEQRYADSRLEIRRETAMYNSYAANADAFFWLNLDERYTWGRYVLDAASLGMPIITTKSTGHAEKLFPYTTLENEFCLDEAIEMGKRLVSDRDFYKAVAGYPEGRMEEFSHENKRNQLLSALDWL